MMKKHKLRMRLFSSIFIGILFFGCGWAQNSSAAKDLLDKTSTTMAAYSNLSMDFDYALDNQAEDVKQEMSGDLILEGDRYVVNLFGTKQIFDGAITYTIIPENEEVNISQADVDDDNAFTPSKFYSFYKSGYTFTMGDLKKIDGKNVQFVNLTPIDSDSEVRIIFVGIDVKTDHIYQIIEVGTNETRTILTASNIRTNQKIDADIFSFDEKKYVELNYMINK